MPYAVVHYFPANKHSCGCLSATAWRGPPQETDVTRGRTMSTQTCHQIRFLGRRGSCLAGILDAAPGSAPGEALTRAPLEGAVGAPTPTWVELPGRSGVGWRCLALD